MNTISDVLPALMNGSDTPVGGTLPVTTPILINAWIAMSAVTPVARSMPKVFGARSAILTPRHIRKPNAIITSIAPINPSSSAIMAKMQSDSR